MKWLFCLICNKNFPESDILFFKDSKDKLTRHILSEHPGTRVKSWDNTLKLIPKGSLPQKEEECLMGFDFLCAYFTEKKETEKKEIAVCLFFYFFANRGWVPLAGSGSDPPP